MEALAVVYLSEGDTKELIDTSDLSKCGEVFRSTSGRYSLCCSHCNCSFMCLTEFSQHIEEHFQLISIATLSEPKATTKADSFKDNILRTNDIKEEPQFNISEIKVESNENHLAKKRTRKKVKDLEEENEKITKPTKVKVNKAAKFKEPINNIWICDICGISNLKLQQIIRFQT